MEVNNLVLLNLAGFSVFIFVIVKQYQKFVAPCVSHLHSVFRYARVILGFFVSVCFQPKAEYLSGIFNMKTFSSVCEGGPTNLIYLSLGNICQLIKIPWSLYKVSVCYIVHLKRFQYLQTLFAIYLDRYKCRLAILC